MIGGPYAETEEPLLPLPSVLWQFRHARRVYRANLDDRDVESLATRRFALSPQRPQIAKRFGFRFAVYLGLDAGRFPVPIESKKLWEGPDATNLESLTRPPIAADRPGEGARLPWRIARSMRDDHVATVPMAHWPNPVAGWYRDLRRVAAFSPVLSRWATLGDYFHLSDRPWDTFSPKADEYVSPYLAQAIARDDPEPISRKARHARLRAGFDGLMAVDALAKALSSPPRPAETELPEPEGLPVGPFDALEIDLETGRLAESSAIEKETEMAGERLARGIVGTGQGGRPGFLVVNPSGMARRAAVVLPGAADDLRPEGPLRSAQMTELAPWVWWTSPPSASPGCPASPTRRPSRRPRRNERSRPTAGRFEMSRWRSSSTRPAEGCGRSGAGASRPQESPSNW